MYRQGIWNYVGRAQYYGGKFADARQSLERALTVYQDDHLARLYLGLPRGRNGDSANGVRDVESGMKGLYDWIEYYESSKPFEAFWDPGREIRSTIEKELKLIAANKIDWSQLIPNCRVAWTKVRRRNRSGSSAGKPPEALGYPTVLPADKILSVSAITTYLTL